MATQDRSPSVIIGQQWSALTDLLTSSAKIDKDDVDKIVNRNASDSMKLGRQDMGLFGFCPSRDEFSLVVCEKCNLLVKPQALKQHTESRHGPTDLSSLGNIPASALNSELGKKLLMPLPTKCVISSQTTTSRDKVSGTFKPLSSGWPPTKASLKQVPASVKNISAPILGVSMKISPLKSVKSGNRITPTTTAITTTVSSATSSPVVKLEKVNNVSSSLSKSGTKECDSLASAPAISNSVQSLDSTKISTLMNGSIKSIISFTTSSTTSATSATNSHSVVSTPVLVAVTRTFTDTSVSTKSVTTFVNTTSLTKPLIIAPIMAVSSSGTVAARPLPGTKSTKSSKDQKERKFLPCKDREYDANKHCGVVVQETGKQCTRSLTCKTHALSLRRAVPGRSKSFDDLLKEHKAAKDALLKAKAEAQNATASANAAASANRVLVSHAAVNSTVYAIKQQMTPLIAQHGTKMLHSTSLPATPKTLMPSSAVPQTAPFVKPRSVSKVFQRFTPSAVLPPAITVKEKPMIQQESSSKPPPSFPEVSHSDPEDTKLHQDFLPHHPRPMANIRYAGRLNDRSCFLFSRKSDYIRAALLSALERQLNPPPHKKLCVESNLPQESQTLSSSQDPYEFNMVDTSGGAAFTLNTSQINASKSTIKPKSKLSTSPVASTNNPLFQHISSGTLATPSALSTSSFSTLCAAPVTVSTSLSPSGLTLNWPVTSWDNVTSHTTSTFPSPILSSTPAANPGKRKRSGSSGGSNNQLFAVASGNGTLPVSPAISVSVSSSGGTHQQTGLTGIIMPSSLNSHQTGNLIAIPSVNLANTNLGQLSAATLGTAKITTSTCGTSPATSHRNNIFKDFSLVLTGIDPSLVNGQYVNITSAQLAELAASQGQTLFLNSFTSSGTNCSATTGNTTNINLASSVPTSRPAKRSRSSGVKLHQTLASSAKLTASALEGLKLIPTSSVITSGSLPPSAVFVDSGSLQGAMLTSVALGTTPTLVALTPSSSNTNSGTVTDNPTQVLCADPSSVVSSSTLVNGVTNSFYDKSVSSSQQHHQRPSSSKLHHHHQNNKTQQLPGIALSSVIQASPSIAVPIPSGSAAQLCSSQAIFKPGGTFNLATKTVGGKLTMQPVSLTFPISVGQAGLAALTSGKPKQQQPQHTLLVTTSGGGGGGGGDIDSATV